MEFDLLHINAHFYGTQPNIVLCDSAQNLLESFKSHESQVEKPNEIPITISQDLINNAVSTSPNMKLNDLLSAICPAYNNRMLKEICARLNFPYDEKVKKIKNLVDLYMVVDGFKKEIESGHSYIYRQNDQAKF